LALAAPRHARIVEQMSEAVFRTYIRRKDMDTVLNCLVTDSVGPGEYLDRFQKAAKEALGFEYGFAVRSPTIGLGLALDALALAAGDAVAVSALAPAYYASVLAAKGLATLFVDCLPESAELDLASLSALEPKPKALVLHDSLGILQDPEALDGLGLPVIEDMSCSLGAFRGERRAGSLGKIAILGLEHDSIVTAGGGALVLAYGKREAQVLRNLSESIDAEIRMTDYNAALGLAQLRDMEASIARRRELAALFGQSIARTRHTMFSQGGEGEAGYWALPVSISSSVKDVRAYANKKEVETELAFEGSLVGKGMVPESACPNARSLALRCLLFPLHQRIGAQAAQRISRVLATLP
jgi:Predicted pyridoxal phosphate-dependent enzyme apparently involved in regulation of cell wall biogenesis